MSNTPLEQNGIDLDSVLEKVNALPSGGAPVINSLSVTENGTYNAPSGVDGYSPVTVNVPQGITPTGKINITDTTETDVTDYATAQVISENLKPENIKKNIDILGVVGSFEGGGSGGEYGIIPTYNLDGTQSLNIVDASDYTSEIRKFRIVTDGSQDTYGRLSFPVRTDARVLYVIINSEGVGLNSTDRYLRTQAIEVDGVNFIKPMGIRYDGSLDIHFTSVSIVDGVLTALGTTVIHLEKSYFLDVYEIIISEHEQGG